MSAPIVITVERRFAAPPETVFDAWLDAAGVGQWLFATPDGVMERVEIDPRVGGRFVVAERRGGVLAEHFGQYLEIDRPRRLVFTFGYAAGDVRDDEETRVTIEIAPDADPGHGRQMGGL